jgi:pyrroloquinoline-quinone synthase
VARTSQPRRQVQGQFAKDVALVALGICGSTRVAPAGWEHESLITYLRQAIEPYDLLHHPFYKAWSAGALTREDLREYASVYYYQVSAFPTYLSALHSRLPDGELRRAVLRNLCEEEIDGTAHSELWLDFAESMGAVCDEVKARKPIEELHLLADTFRLLMESPRRVLPHSTRMNHKSRAFPERRHGSSGSATEPTTPPAVISIFTLEPTFITRRSGRNVLTIWWRSSHRYAMKLLLAQKRRHGASGAG